MTSDPPQLWVDGELTLRVRGPDRGPSREVAIGRPYALVGRIDGADVLLEGPAVSNRHVYLHLDRRGLFAVDLATRSGTRVGPGGGPAGWLAPGQGLDVGGYRVDLVGGRVDGVPLERLSPPPTDDPLADAGAAPLARVTLYPGRSPEAPLVLGSELVFLGRSASCGVRVEGESASRTHCVLARAHRAAYLVDLVGRGTWLNHRPLRGAAPLADGDALMVGTAQFEVRVEFPWERPPVAVGRETLPAEVLAPGPAELLAAGPPPLPPGLLSNEDQTAVLAWMMSILQAGQNAILQQQAEFQRSLSLMVRQMHLDNSSLLNKQLERVDAINRELATLRDEVRHRFSAGTAPNRPGLPPLPPATPLRVTPHTPPADPAAATSWLLNRVSKLEEESRSTWRDLLGRLGGPSGRSS